MPGIDGLISGLDTKTIVAQLMAVERLPKQQLLRHQSDSQTMVSTLQTLNTLFTTMATGAKAFTPDTITGQSAWTGTTATSSSISTASAITGPGALPGSVSFKVTSLATTGSAVSSGTVSSLTAPVAGGPFMVSKGAANLGVSALAAGATLTAGAHKIEVTQSSAAATVSGSVALAPAVTIDGTNNQVSFFRDGSGSPTTITLNAGAYTPAQLAAEIGRASSGTVTGSIDTSGRLSLSTDREGSSVSLQLAAANTDLGLTDLATVGVGVNGIVKLDGVTTTVASVGAGDQLTLAGVGTDSVVASLAGGLRKGAGTTSAVTVAAGATLSDVVRALNGSGTGVSATAVQVSDGAYRLQVTSTTSGSASDVTMSSGAFPGGTSSLGNMLQLSAGVDTVLHIGTGPGAFDATSSTASVSGLLPGVTITALKADPTTSVLVNVASDTGGMADKMASMVAQANSVLSFVRDRSAFDATTKTGGALVGDGMTRDLARRIASAVIGSSSNTPAQNGVAVARDGTITFDRAVFLASYTKDPAAVTATMTAMTGELADVATKASDPHTGSVTARITGEQSSILSGTKDIAAFEDRMTLRQQTLQHQYANLEKMLGKLKSQSDWLTSQLASLTNMNSSK